MNGFGSALSLLSDALRFLTGPTGYGIAVWILAIVFVWSGTAKLRRPTLAAMAMTDFGVARRVRPRLGSALGAAEVALALVLVAGLFPAPSLIVTAGLLWFFVALIARSLARGKEFACFCFGDADSKLSRLTLVRTAALAVLASALAFASVAGGPGGGPVKFDGTYFLQGVSAAALVGTIVLASVLPKLLRWNGDPYGAGNTEVG